MMPLTMAKTGEPVTIRKITGKDEVRLHLAELGFVVDSEVSPGDGDRRQCDRAGQGQPGCTEPDHGQSHYDLRRNME